MTEHVLVEKAEKLLVLTLNRPEKKNALTRAMYKTLATEIANADTDPEVRCILIMAHGDMFTAGNDLADFAAAGMPRFGAQAGGWKSAASRPGPLANADCRGRQWPRGRHRHHHAPALRYGYCGKDASLITPFVNLALVPEAASSLLMPLRIGHVRAFEMFVLGEPVVPNRQ